MEGKMELTGIDYLTTGKVIDFDLAVGLALKAHKEAHRNVISPARLAPDVQEIYGMDLTRTQLVAVWEHQRRYERLRKERQEREFPRVSKAIREPRAHWIAKAATLWLRKRTGKSTTIIYSPRNDLFCTPESDFPDPNRSGLAGNVSPFECMPKDSNNDFFPLYAHGVCTKGDGKTYIGIRCLAVSNSGYGTLFVNEWVRWGRWGPEWA